MSTPEKVKQELLQKLKGLSDTVTDSIGDMAKGRPIFCESTVTNSRLQLCNSCPHFVKSTSQCKKCGCFMSAKTRLKSATCPIGKWGKDI